MATQPNVLVTTEWVVQRGKDANVRVVEVDVDTTAYDQGHVPGAAGWNWTTELCDTLVRDIVDESGGVDDIRQSSNVGGAMLSLRAFMFERVYLGPAAREQRALAVDTVRRIFERLVAHPEELPSDRPGDLAERVTDYLAGMTDRFALAWR